MIAEIIRIKKKKCKLHRCMRVIINRQIEYEIHQLDDFSGWTILGPLPGTMNTHYKSFKEANEAIIAHNKAIEDELNIRQLVMEF